MKMWGSLSATLQLLLQEAESTGAPRFNGFRKDLFGKPRGALLNFIRRSQGKCSSLRSPLLHMYIS